MSTRSESAAVAAEVVGQWAPECLAYQPCAGSTCTAETRRADECELKVVVGERDHLPRFDTCGKQAHGGVPCGFCRLPFDAQVVRAGQASGYARAMTATYHAVIRRTLRHRQVQAIVMQDE